MIDLEKICDDLYQIVNKSQPYVQEYDIIDLRPNEIEFLFEENCLVLNKIHLKKLYFYLKEQFLKRNEFKLSTLKCDQLSLLILLINPQFSSVWSQRKELVCSNSVEIEHELRLNSLILDKNFKSEHGYMHRRWLVKRLGVRNIQEFVQHECEMVYRLSRKIKSNYYCWSYLNWVFDYFKGKLTEKSAFMSDTLEKHQKNVLELSVSDFCVFHFRLNLLKLIIQANTGDLVCLLVNEMQIADDLLLRYPKYQTVWNFRKYFYRIIESSELLKSDKGEQVRSLFIGFKSNLVDDESTSELQLSFSKCLDEHSSLLVCLLRREMLLADFVKQFAKAREDEKVLIESYSKLHKEFLEKFFTFK